ncbi:hypothetical protein [Nocardioides mesophilus]|uniref:Uncharacterized protein n=1 Tax=Nocardioides mesophilus TaxID=433659 RepID=A0A7G9R9B7_9ACTN|nr:hypothetical protein [Nocardioides mesophilus]QNN52192.1 hypothetical protein H9L09_17095 [Nocardioides mesophilus]
MGVSATGQHGLSMRSVRSLFVVVAVFVGFAIYFYGPPVTPALRTAANEACNEYAGGNFRSYVLSWESGPGSTPHWSCWDKSRPQVRAVSLGWWVDPFS